jgi:LysM repeat protein
VRRRRAPRAQARRDANYPAYVVGFTLIVLILVGFLYVGLNWANDNTRTAGLVTIATPVPPQPVAVAQPSPSPAVDASTYVVKQGDTPVAIAQQHHVKVDDLLRANNITDPRSLQVGQTLRIPPTSD